MFADVQTEIVRGFFERAFAVPTVYQVVVDQNKRRADILFFSRTGAASTAILDIADSLNGQSTAGKGTSPALPAHLPMREGVVRLARFGAKLSSWLVRHEVTGRVRFHNSMLYRNDELAQAIERELMNTFGVESYRTNTLTATVVIEYDSRHLQRDQLVEILDSVLQEANHNLALSPLDLDLPVCSASFVLAATARFLVPSLLPLSAAVFVATVIPSFESAYQVLFKEKRLGVDVLDAIVVLVCLATRQIFPGTVLAWTLSAARKLMKRTEDNSKKMLLNVFGKQPRFVWLDANGVEVETPLEKLKVNDVIVIHTGEAVPVDGEVVGGMAMIDQHTLTGESAPAEKTLGDKVFAATTLIAGKIRVSVTSTGEETTAAKLARILNDTARFKLHSQSQGERLADHAVTPTLALGALGLATIGVNSAVAIVNCDLGTGIRMAAPTAMLSSLTLCAQYGILVKDGRALEVMPKVDTFLFDKTGTLTRERPEVGRIFLFDQYSENDILSWAAAAENKFSHPIAKAILDRFKQLNVPLPQTDDSKYRVGYGIIVHVDGHTVHVGSARFMKHEKITLPDALEPILEEVHDDGNSLILVSVDGDLSGALEMRAAERPEAAAVIAALRRGGAKHLAIISGDHERPTRKLAERLKMDRYFAEVLPEDKAKYVELLQAEGRTVCFIGDGVNDSIALKKADLSISLRGASTIATDTAQVVFMEESLKKLIELQMVARDLERNVKRSWLLILGPNLICIGGAFFGGFGVMHSMVFNQIGGLLALGNGLLPLRQVAKARAKASAKEVHAEGMPLLQLTSDPVTT